MSGFGGKVDIGALAYLINKKPKQKFVRCLIDRFVGLDANIDPKSGYVLHFAK